MLKHFTNGDILVRQHLQHLGQDDDRITHCKPSIRSKHKPLK
jgi:hypothetical protein